MKSQQAANHLLSALSALGVDRFFVAPGSRSQALTIAASKLEQSGRSKLIVRLDERSLGFTALGSALARKKPAAIIVTSGTAVANLLPAVLEAFHSSTELILLTADRPARLRGTGANQTLDQQAEIFGYAAKSINIPIDVAEAELEAAATEAVQTRGPVQLNIEFDLPLSDGKLPLPTLNLVANQNQESIRTLEVPVDDETIVIAGAGGAAARDFADQANLPLIAEPSSGARSGDKALQFPIAALEANRERIKRAIVFGKPTLSRAVQSLVSSVEVFTQSGHGYGDFNPHGSVTAFADQLIPVGCGSDENLARYQRSVELDERQEFVAKVWSLSNRLVIGASDLIRQLDQVAKPKDLEVYSNRGLAGIDGTVSTGIGVALERGETTLLIGDLTLLHDASGLNLSDLGSPQLRIIVGNDRGGHIFSRLEVAQEISEEDLSRLFVTPQQVDMAALAAAYGWEYRVCNSPAQLEENWEITGPTLIEYLL